ncbi:ABC transporter permease [Domibacillus sp. DTU_2020_1001157_1_SI_ALB_TIR_016]|uniref:ABC transporter permease n=1 Tax=Domibacillus sp. DTU_2020_1001157_1_SI_ALB_TIR_016 TaxID=3077789 RepID=UPI0028F11EB1|nr:ABC transporter permease [Domibacillus sp. DTU_2020_1001157_1_SI_ALB_TIR_016]WNS78349.1 ABC transporter permease [Domibacillus sp. DTU_2020_1001157_1_SI_ALB_TIR_016]
MSANTGSLKKALTLFDKKQVFSYEKKMTWSGTLIGLSLLTLAFIVLCALFPQWIAPYSVTEMNPEAIMKPPSFSHILGTDQFGRDIFSLLVYGARQSLITGLAAVLIAGVTGTIIGLVAGYTGGLFDVICMRMMDIAMTIPNILLAIAISSAMGASLVNIILAISIAATPGYTRVIRSQVISLKHRPFIDASQSIGTSHFEIVIRHILPNCLSPLIVMGTIGIGSSILIGTGLSFLGLGVVQEIPDWGYLLSQGRSYITVAWWIVAFPGFAITMLVVAVNLLGDALRNRLDPKQSRVS